MDLKTLTTFVTVARLKNFTAAARELHTVQPTVSRHIYDLENELETRLFERTTHQVDLTLSGEKLLPEALQIIENDQRVKYLIKQIDADENQEIKVGYLATACTFFLPELINRFRSKHESVQLRLYEMTPAEQIEAMIDNNVDIVFSRSSHHLDDRYFSSYLVYEDGLTALLPQKHSLASKKCIVLEDLYDEKLYLFHRNEWQSVYEKIIRVCRVNGFNPNVVGNPMNMRHLVTIVSSGLGISIVPRCIQFIANDSCVCRPINQIDISLPLTVYFRRGGKSRLVNAFVSHTIELSTEIQAMLKDEMTIID